MFLQLHSKIGPPVAFELSAGELVLGPGYVSLSEFSCQTGEDFGVGTVAVAKVLSLFTRD